MNKVVEFFKEIGGSTAIVPHGDADGCASGALVRIILKRLGKDGEFLFPDKGWSRLDKKLLEQLKEFDNVIVVDIGEKSNELMDGIAQHSKLCWIDHHKDEKEIKGDFVYFNPHEEGAGEYSAPPASYLVYQIGSRLTDVDRLCWIAAVGVVGDKADKRCRDVIDKTFRLFPNLRGSPDYGELSILRKMVTLVSSGRSIAGAEGAKLSAENFYEAGEQPAAFLLSKKGRFLKRQMLNTKRMTDKILDEKSYVVYPNLVICEINSKYGIQNYAASRLRMLFPKKAICVTNLALSDGSRAELRRGRDSEVDLRGAARAIASKLPNSCGGGHKAAAGVRTSAGWPELKKELLNQFSK